MDTCFLAWDQYRIVRSCACSSSPSYIGNSTQLRRGRCCGMSLSSSNLMQSQNIEGQCPYRSVNADDNDVPARPSPSMPRLPKQKTFATNRILRSWRDGSVQFPPRISSNDLDQGSSPSAISVDPSPSASASETKDGLDEEVATVPATIAQKIHAMMPTLPPFPSPFTSPIRPKSPVLPAEIELPGSPPMSPTGVVNEWKLLGFLSPRAANRTIEPNRQSILSALDLLRSPRGKRQEDLTSPIESTSTVLDCVDDNNSVMIYGPLEPDDTSEVEIACSEIVSVYEDGDEIRTPQARFVPLPTESIEQILMGANESPEGCKGKEESCNVADSEPFIPPDEPWKSPLSKNGQLPEREYRVWVPSLTKISVQTMWWGFKMWVRFSSNSSHNTNLYFSDIFLPAS